ncbi:alcohol dehydrogenase catalytic domain-containing protein [Streptosporangium sp. NPDC001681]|uniref:alcohol dehydrogenase catalytic domain-containing protein n=1 Tax=Streptosporangium sp. NPDC001681 TaxID=3154395 RepID=UPI00332E6E5A
MSAHEPQARTITFERFGPADVLTLTSAAIPRPGPGEAVVEVRAIGVDFMDVSTRLGFNPTVRPPATPGVEGSGVIRALGPGTDDLHVGRRVAWYHVPGSYTTHLLAPAAALVPSPTRPGIPPHRRQTDHRTLNSARPERPRTERGRRRHRGHLRPRGDAPSRPPPNQPPWRMTRPPRPA